MSAKRSRVCPVEKAWGLDNRFRSWLQNPRKILRSYVAEGMSVLDLGCGPGFFTVEMARMVGGSGRVVASDLQEGMLLKLKKKLAAAAMENRVVLHRCQKGKIGLSDCFDFILAFYMVHEVTAPKALFVEMTSLLKPQGRILIVEPIFHVSRAAFAATTETACDTGLRIMERPRIALSRSAVLLKADRSGCEAPLP